MSEIEKKATQIAQESVINVQPFDFASIEYGAIKMGYWMKERMIEKAELFLIDAFKELPNGYGTFKIKREGSIEQLIEDFKKYMEV